MTRWLVRGLPLPAAIFLVGLGLAFMLAPQYPMERLDLAATGPAGLSFVRGDVAASLIVIGLLILRAVRSGKGRQLDIPILWVLVLSAGRIIGIMSDTGGHTVAWMLVPDLFLLLVLVPARQWMRSRT
jgi:hypothetical protein